MELIKKTICQAVTTGTTGGTGSTKVVLPNGYYTKPEDVYLGWTGASGGTGYIVVPDLAAVYNIKIGLTAEIRDIGFFDAYLVNTEEEQAPPAPPSETFYYVDSDESVFTDTDGAKFIWN
jgi:hypothetical protein